MAAIGVVAPPLLAVPMSLRLQQKNVGWLQMQVESPLDASDLSAPPAALPGGRGMEAWELFDDHELAALKSALDKVSVDCAFG
jgi:hypothetical protein